MCAASRFYCLGSQAACPTGALGRVATVVLTVCIRPMTTVLGRFREVTEQDRLVQSPPSSEAEELSALFTQTFNIPKNHNSPPAQSETWD